MKTIKHILSWLLFLAAIAAIYFLWPYIPKLHTPSLSVPLILLFSLSVAFMNIEVLHLGSVKPFNCIKCLTGWISLIIALCFHCEVWYFMLPAGVFVGAMFELIKGRL